jgi:hypothetical protein
VALNIVAHSAGRFVIAVEVGKSRYKIAQIVWAQRDGSVFVTFPYLKDGGGQLCLASLLPDSPNPGSYNLGDGGVVTSHFVKYSHHPDGRVHFSQTGKIRTAIKKRGVSLQRANGHLFTIQAQGISRFAREGLQNGRERGATTRQRSVVPFLFETGFPVAVKFVAHWHSPTDFARRIVKHNDETPWIACRTPDGGLLRGVILTSSAEYNGERRLLVLTCESVPRIVEGQETFLSFLGGFDESAIALNHEAPTSFLALAYPLPQVAHHLSSIDL